MCYQQVRGKNLVLGAVCHRSPFLVIRPKGGLVIFKYLKHTFEMEISRTNRIASIDILRGLVMIIMALDHTRDFFHQPAMISDPLNADTTTIPIYFTRWITHFCAPTFVFLSGVSAYLSSLKKTRAEASNFLLKRGLWLVLVEVTLVTFGITFNPKFHFFVFQVIWAIGWSMVILGLLIRISPKLVLIVGLLLFFGHNILDYVDSMQFGKEEPIWTLLFRARNSLLHAAAPPHFGDFYAILPWTGAMLLGYSIGQWFRKDFPAERRKKLLLITGSSFIVLFIVLRATNLYGNPDPWIRTTGLRNNLLNFINTSKYPPSLLYLSMTLGPSCLFLAVSEGLRGKLVDIVSVYGKVPFFYYILHFYLLHTILMVVFFATGHTTSEIALPFTQYPFYFRPLAFGYTLPVVYLIWLCVVVFLYFPCRWYSKYKQTHKQWWLSYV